MAEVCPISVVISTLDRPDALAACLEGVLAQAPAPFEVVVVDQSAGPATRELVERTAGGPTELVYVKHRGRGLGASQNTAVAVARGDIVAVIDDDCVPGGGWLRALRRAFAEGEDRVLVAGRVLPLGPARPGLYPVSSRTSTRPASFAGRVAPWHVGSGNNFAVRRSAFLAVDGCDERLGPGSPGRGGVDMDLFYRLLRAGGRASYDPAAVVYHEQKPLDERLARRPLYGYGTGACFALWARQRDAAAPWLLIRWMGWRGARLALAAVRGNWTLAREESLMLASTIAGLGYGLSAPARPPGHLHAPPSES